MNTSKLFQDFGAPKRNPSKAATLPVEEVEDAKLQAFENGYQAGWDDAVKAQAETLTHVSADLAVSLQSASFEYHELRATLNGIVKDIMEQVTHTVLPEMARRSIGAHVREQIGQAAQSSLDMPLEIAVSAESEDAVRAALGGDPEAPFTLTIDPLLSPNQVLLRLGKREVEINLDRILSDIRSAISAYFETQPAEVSDGRSA